MTTESYVPLLDSLRHATRAHHAAIEHQLTADGGAWTRERYGRMLGMFEAVIAPIEATLVEHLGGVFAAPPPATRTARLAADLSALGFTSSTSRFAAAIEVGSHAEALGVGYVLQGSLLGGAIICRQMRADGAGPVVPASYLELYGAGLGAAWKRYCEAIDTFGRTAGPQQRELAVAAAVRTFEACDTAFAALP